MWRSLAHRRRWRARIFRVLSAGPIIRCSFLDCTIPRIPLAGDTIYLPWEWVFYMPLWCGKDVRFELINGFCSFTDFGWCKWRADSNLGIGLSGSTHHTHKGLCFCFNDHPRHSLWSQNNHNCCPTIGPERSVSLAAIRDVQINSSGLRCGSVGDG